jgi:hypothetical protein
VTRLQAVKAADILCRLVSQGFGKNMRMSVNYIEIAVRVSGHVSKSPNKYLLF